MVKIVAAFFFLKQLSPSQMYLSMIRKVIYDSFPSHTRVHLIWAFNRRHCVLVELDWQESDVLSKFGPR